MDGTIEPAHGGGARPTLAARRHRRTLTRTALTLALLGAAVGPAAGQSSAYGVTFDRERLGGLPSAPSLWSLLETTEAWAVLDRVEGGGLAVGSPGLLGVHGSSWTQTSFRAFGLDATDPERGGVPLVIPDLAVLESLRVDTVLLPVEHGGPGPAVSLALRRPGPRWQGAAELSALPGALQPDAGAGPLSIARFGAWSDVGLEGAGPLGERSGLLVAARRTRSRRIERDEPARRADLSTALAHFTWSPTAADELSATAGGHGADRPEALGSAAALRDERERALFVQSSWTRSGPAWTWSIAGGYRRARTIPGPLPDAAVAERLRHGPLPLLLSAARRTRERWDLEGRLAPPPRDGSRHRWRAGAAATLLRSSAEPPAPIGPMPETVAGRPARVWEYGPAGPSRHRAGELAAFAADRVQVAGGLSVEAGLRLEHVAGRAAGGGSLAWTTLSPRVHGRWALSGREAGEARRGWALFTGYARYRHRLLLGVLDVGDPGAPQGVVHRWDDDGDGRLEPGERGPVVARVGPGGERGSIDPGLAPPWTEEAAAGIERGGGRFSARLTGLYRWERGLLETVGVGADPARDAVRFVPDPGGDLALPADDQLLPLFDRDPSRAGGEGWLLTNPADHTAQYGGVELELEVRPAAHASLRLTGAAFRADGIGSHRGFRATENDQGVIGEAFEDPNAATHRRGRLFFDRAYTLKISGLWRAAPGFSLAAAARYQDGQPFSRLVVVPDLRQGVEAVQAIPNGRARFTYTLTLDARAEVAVALGARRLRARLEAFNLLDDRREVEEDVVSGPAFRRVLLVQPPRAVRVGLRVEF